MEGAPELHICVNVGLDSKIRIGNTGYPGWEDRGG